MIPKIKILFIEHDQNDLDLIQYELKKGGINYTAEIVQDGPAYEIALKNFIPDIILSDYALPSFDGLTAFKIREQMAPDTPFVFVSGTIGEENSIDLINNGVTDFVLKDKLFTLNTKVKRALKESKENKQIIETEQKLIQSEGLLRQAQQLARMGNWNFDFKTDKLTWSEELYNVFDTDHKTFLETHGSFVHLIEESDRPLVLKTSKHSQETGEPFNIQYRITTAKGAKRVIEEFGYGEKDKDGKVIRLFGTAQDITERKRAENELLKSEEKFRSVFENSTVGKSLTSPDGKILQINQAYANMLGYSIIEMQKLNFLEITHPDDLAISKEALRCLLANEKTTFKMEKRYFHKNGSIVWTNVGITLLRDSNDVLQYFITSILDITQQKIAEEEIKKSEIQIRSFAKHLNQVIEDERSSIAREIHDELGQQLVGIKIGLASLNKSNAPSPKTIGAEQSEKITDMMKDVDTTIQSMRKISTQLRPGILDTLGLIPSIQWLGSEFEKKTKIKCKMEVSVTEQKFEKNISTCFFRICQEALTNISKHSGANEVIINVSQNKNELMLKISDNGKGIVSEKLENPFSMGLLGMRERANIIGAEFKIESKIGKGTTIFLKANI